MILPKIYEDAISCFCPRTAWEMRRMVERYLLTGERPYINKRTGATPTAVLRLIFNNINQTAQLNCAIKLRNQVEEDQTEMEREETNIDTLPPVPSIIDTSVEDKRKEKKEEKDIAREENNNNHSARAEKISDSENKTLKHLENDFHSSIPLEKSLTLIYPDDPAEIFRLKLLKKTHDEEHRRMEALSQCNQLIDYYNKCVGKRLQQVIERYPALIQTAGEALDVLGSEKAKRVTDRTLKSRFLCGENKLGFKADFNWIYNEKHYYKILNNEYYEYRHIDLEVIERERDNRDFLINEFSRNNKHKHLDETLW